MTHDQDPPTDSTRAEIRAELADHLAESAAQQTREGLDPVEAEARARAQFGNVARIERACWWIQTGDEIMFRTIAVGLLVAVTIGLVAVTLGGWRLQANFAHRMDQLAQQLTEMNATQRSLLAAQQATQPRGLRGRTYLGDPSEPAAGAEVFVLRMPDALLVRRLQTDAQGRFEVSSLPPGEYSLVAGLIGPGNELLNAEDFAVAPGGQLDVSAYHIQSRPFYFDPRSTPAEIELDLLLPQGDFAFGLSQALPDKIEENDALVQFELKLCLLPAPQLSDLPWTPVRSEPQRWPIVGDGLKSYNRFSFSQTPADFSQGLVTYTTRPWAPSTVGSWRILLAGDYPAAVLILPYLVKPNALSSQLKLGHGGILQTQGQNPAVMQQSNGTSEQTPFVPMDVAEWLDIGPHLVCYRLEPQKYGTPLGNAISGEDGIMSASISSMVGSLPGVVMDSSLVSGGTKARSEYISLPPDKYRPIEVRHGTRTHVEIQVPADLEADIREVLNFESPTVEQLSEALRARILPLKVKSFEPLSDEH